MKRCEYVCVLIVIYFLGTLTVLLSGVSVIISVNPLKTTNITRVNECEYEAIYFLYGWGIMGIILGSMVIFIGAIETILFTTKLIEDGVLAYMFNVTIALGLGFFYMFGSFVTGYALFRHCTDLLRYYYWAIICAVFSISTTLLSLAFLSTLYLLCNFSSDIPDL